MDMEKSNVVEADILGKQHRRKLIPCNVMLKYFNQKLT